MRKVVQIAVSPETDNQFTIIYALCDDSTIWELIRVGDVLTENPKWKKLPPVPYTEEDKR